MILLAFRNLLFYFVAYATVFIQNTCIICLFSIYFRIPSERRCKNVRLHKVSFKSNCFSTHLQDIEDVRLKQKTRVCASSLFCSRMSRIHKFVSFFELGGKIWIAISYLSNSYKHYTRVNFKNQYFLFNFLHILWNFYAIFRNFYYILCFSMHYYTIFMLILQILL